MRGRRSFQLTLIGALLSAALIAEAASPVVKNILPRGAQRGSTVEVRFVGQNIEDAVDLLFHQPGITLEGIVKQKPKSFVCKLVIAPDCPLGRHAIRVRTETGLSNPFIFSVGALPEMEETEPNGNPDEAQPIPLETTVNGVVLPEDVDYFAVDLNKDTRLAVEVEGIRLGHTLFDPKLRLFGPGGHELVSEDDTPAMRQDAAFVYTATEPGRYCVAISEASYGGSKRAEYRLHIGTFPRPLGVTPLGGPAGSPVTVRWLGDSENYTKVVPAAFSSDAARIEISSPDGFAPTPLRFRASDLTTTLESEPNDAADQAAVIEIPGAFDGVIERAGDVDWFAFNGTKDQNLNVQVIARAMGSPLDSVLEVLGPDGAQVFHSDDSDTLDSGGRVTLPADGRYTVSIRDHLGHGGLTFAYRVEIAPVTPSLWFTPVDNEPNALTVPQNNHAFMLLSLNRREFDGPVELTFDGLPEGVTAHHDPIPAGATQIPVVFKAESSATPVATLVDAQGVWQNDDATTVGGLSHTIPLVTGRNQTVFDALHTDRIAMAVGNTAPFTLELVPPKSPVPKNGWCTVTVRATREDGFNDPITITPPWKPKSIGLPSGTIAEGETETQLRLEVYEGAAIGTANLVLTGESAGHLVSTPFTPVTIEDAWVTLDIQTTQGEQGGTVSWPGTLTVSREFEEDIVIQPNGLPRGVTAEPITLAAATADIAFNLNIAPDAPEGKQGPIGFDTTVTVNGEPVHIRLGGAELKVFKPLPPKLAAPAPAPEPEQKPDTAPARRTRFPTEM